MSKEQSLVYSQAHRVFLCAKGRKEQKRRRVSVQGRGVLQSLSQLAVPGRWTRDVCRMALLQDGCAGQVDIFVAFWK